MRNCNGGGIDTDKNRYCELRYYCRRYRTLTRGEKRIIDIAAKRAIGARYAGELKRNVCEGIAFKSINAPFSERDFARRKKRFFAELDRILQARAARYGMILRYIAAHRTEFEAWWRNENG